MVQLLYETSQFCKDTQEIWQLIGTIIQIIRIAIPILIVLLGTIDLGKAVIAGKEDAVGAKGKGPTKLVALYKKYGLTNVELKLYDHMRHEILNEPEHQMVYDDVVNFYEK